MSVKTMIKSAAILVAMLMVGAFVISGVAVAAGNEEKVVIEKPKVAIEKVAIEKAVMPAPAPVEKTDAGAVVNRQPIFIRNPFLINRLNPFLFNEGLIGVDGFVVD